MGSYDPKATYAELELIWIGATGPTRRYRTTSASTGVGRSVGVAFRLHLLKPALTTVAEDGGFGRTNLS